jgi:uncharacterized repeat protein (TIGR03803 family)
MNYKKFLGAASAALMIIIIVILVLSPGACAQSKYKTLYTFTGGTDGSQPVAGLAIDQAGNLYGTTWSGGDLVCGYVNRGCGTLFKLTPKPNGTWKESVLHAFTGGSDGRYPAAGVILDQAGNLYGTTEMGGDRGSGNVFKFTPGSGESVLHSFGAGGDGMYTDEGLIFDQAGNLYGTTHDTAFKLVPNQDGSWTESVLYTFCSLPNCGDGVYPQGPLVLDETGDLYSTTAQGEVCTGHCGGVFKLSPHLDGSWIEKVLYSFTGGNDGDDPEAGLIRDQAGNFYGTTSRGGSYGAGVVFSLTPGADGKSWKEKVLHQFTGGRDGSRPYAGLIFDQAGNLYGTTSSGGARGYGVVFKLAPNTKGGWNETVLHAFLNHPGAIPSAGLILDAEGNLYGTTTGKDDGFGCSGSPCGTVFEITP